MSIFTSSSRQGIRNLDGTWRINCSQCRQYICDSQVKLGKVLCAICDASLNGRVLTPEAIEMYNAGKMGRRGVTMVNLSELAAAPGEKFALKSMGAFIGQALGFKKGEPAPLESVKVAKGKRRGRLFEGIDIEQKLEQPENIGSMQEIDSALTAAKEKGKQ